MLKGKRVGLLTNPSGVNRNLDTTIEVLRAAPGVKLVALFGPEHGVYGDVPAGEKVAETIDERTGLPAYSLYGKTFRPTREMLQGLDALVYDLQDTGCRSYTFISSMGVAMDACGEAGVEFVVLDRPNPLGGKRVEGPMLDNNSGRGQPLGRALRVWPDLRGAGADDQRRRLDHESLQTDGRPHERLEAQHGVAGHRLPWVPSSPHVPHGESSLYQVATGMLGESAASAPASVTPCRSNASRGRTSIPINSRSAQRLPAAGREVPARHLQAVLFHVLQPGDRRRAGLLRRPGPRRPLTAINFYGTKP